MRARIRALLTLTVAAALLAAAATGRQSSFLERLRRAPPRVFALDGGAASGVEFAREWRDGLCHSRVTNIGTGSVALGEIVLFDMAHELPPDTPLYGEGFTMLSQTAGTLSAPVDVGRYTDRGHYKLREPDGLHSVYGMLMLAPKGAERILLGFTTCKRFVGRLDFSGSRLQISVDAEGRRIGPGETWELEVLFAETGVERGRLLERFATAIAEKNPRPTPRPAPTGWCSWYCFGPEVTAKNVSDNLDFIASRIPALRFVQIDDGYQPHMGDWLDSGPSFGGKVRDVLAQIRKRGFEPALWLAPFVADGESRLFREHPDWFVRGSDRGPLASDQVTFGGWRLAPWYVLDGTHPEVQKHLESLFRTLREEWGVRYFKLDALFWGALPGGVFHDNNATRVEAYRRGMEAIRRGAGDAFVLGCNHPLWPSLGLLDGSRSSLDIERTWDSIRGTGRENLLRAWQNDRLWWNDPDCVVLSAPLTDEQVQFHATVILASGGMVLSGDDLPKLAARRLPLLKRLCTPAGTARFDEESLGVGRIEAPGRTVLVLFNWGDQPEPRAFEFAGKMRASDFWTDAELGVHEGRFEIAKLGARSARAIVLTPVK